jgi:high-affinity Fe2+/Pb2+ permease
MTATIMTVAAIATYNVESVVPVVGSGAGVGEAVVVGAMVWVGCEVCEGEVAVEVGAGDEVG